MSWIDKLYQTYENNVGVANSDDEDAILLPICHTTQNAQIEVTIDGDGNFIRASVITKDDSQTIVPCSESSSSRSGSCPINHPLADKLQYLAGDFVEFGGEVTSGYVKTPQKPYEIYINDLKAWCNSENSHYKAEAIYKYVSKKTLIADLVKHKILYLKEFGDRAGKLLYEWESDEEKPEIFVQLSGKKDGKDARKPWQADAFIRWKVEVPGDLDSSTQFDQSLQNSWVAYYLSTKSSKGICFVSGKEAMLADSHPAKIRNAGDKAKLISANDSSGFTYRGRFIECDEVCGVDFEISQKAYNALRWLIARQGWRSDSQAIVSWAVSGDEIPQITDNSEGFFESDDEPTISTAQEFSIRLTKRIAGYSAKIDEISDVVIMGLDSAVPGRLAITYYRELKRSEFLERIQSWHSNCYWTQNFGKDHKFIGAPSPNDIAKAAYGNDVDSKLKRATILRLIPCIIDGAEFPLDLLSSCIHKAIKRHAFDPWEWEKILGITCALYKFCNREKEEYTMALDRTRNTRDYLFGRLLAVADGIEGLALKDANEKRPTNASRLMQRFADYPCSTWRNLELALVPYKARLGGRIKKYDANLKEIMNLINPDDFKDDPLGGEFLLGFHCQRDVLMTKETDLENN